MIKKRLAQSSALLLLLTFVLMFAPKGAPQSSGPTLKKIAEFDLPGPGGKRFDYLTVDPDDHYLLSAHLAAKQTSELLTWGAGNLSAFWAFARGCDRVMHLQFRAGELGVSLVQVRAKRFEDSRSMRRTEWGHGDTKLLFRGFEISGIL